MEALENIKDSISKDLEETRNKKKELSKKFTQAKVWHYVIHVYTYILYIYAQVIIQNLLYTYCT